MRTVRLCDGKYEFDLDHAGTLLSVRRNGNSWPVVFEQFRFSNAAMAAFHRITELEDLLMNQSTNQPSIPSGDYQGSKANPDNIEVGFSKDRNVPEMILQCYVPDLRREVSVVLHFSTPGNAQVSMEMLRATGWSGKDISDLTGIGSKEFTLRIEYEMYDNKQQMRTTILTGGGRIKSSKPTDLRTFAAAVARVTGNTSGGGGSGSPPPPPFGD